MAFKRPVAGEPVTVEDFGQPVYDWITAQTPTAWTNLAFASGWNGAPYGKYRKVGDMVEIIGEIGANANQSANSTAATLPAGYRPTANCAYLCPYFDGTNNFTWVMVAPSGAMTVSRAASSGHSVHIWPIRYSITA